MVCERAVAQPAPSERDLADRLRGGDDTAIHEVSRTYGRRLWALAFRLTRHAGRADEVVQESLLAAWQSASPYRDESSLLTWLRGIVRNQALNAIRRRTPPLAPLDDAREVPSVGALPEAAAEANERASRLRAALAALPADQRAVLDLVFYQGLSLAETAAACGCPVGTVKSRLHAAKGRLRRLLESTDAERRS